MNITIITATDSAGKNWFLNTSGSWQERRDSQCHFLSAKSAGTAYRAAIARDRFLSSDDRMIEIEMRSLT